MGRRGKPQNKSLSTLENPLSALTEASLTVIEAKSSFSEAFRIFREG